MTYPTLITIPKSDICKAEIAQIAQQLTDRIVTDVSEIIASVGALSESDLRSLNEIIVKEINQRISQKRNAIKSTLSYGSRVTINDPRCSGKTYTIEKISGKTAILVEEGSTRLDPVFGRETSKKIRASITLIQSAS
jgi:hypothetical protein